MPPNIRQSVPWSKGDCHQVWTNLCRESNTSPWRMWCIAGEALTWDITSLYQLARAAVTKGRLGGSNNRNALSYSSGSWNSEMKVEGLPIDEGTSVLVLSWGFWWFPLLQMHPPISVFTFTWHSPCVHTGVHPFYKDTGHIGLMVYPTPIWPHLN